MTMQAVIYGGPWNITIEERPVPRVTSPDEVIVKVVASAICGSDLHLYRGHDVAKEGIIMGHEYCGYVHEVGSSVKGFKVGDRVVSPFSTCCGTCFYCKKGISARCPISKTFGSNGLEGAQAEYVKVPYADETLLLAPRDLSDEALVLMGDIYPTGFFASEMARTGLPDKEREGAVCVVIGCGPVGICAITAASEWIQPGKLFAVDSVPDRLEHAKSHGAIPLNLGSADLKDVILNATDGRGADVVLEIVGTEDAYATAYDLVRPFGYISSVGFHQSGVLLTGPQAWKKNIRASFGKCSVRSLFPQALESLRRNRAAFEGGFISHRMPLKDAAKAYELFEQHKARKILFHIEK